MQYIGLIGRILFSLLFIMAALMGHFGALEDTAGYAAAMGVPAPKVAVIVTGIMILLGGLSVLLGYQVKIGTALLVIFLLATNFMIHKFWAMPDAMQMQIQMSMFMKNLSLAGAALYFFHAGTGSMSLGKS